MRLKVEYNEEQRDSAMKKMIRAALNFEGNSTSVEFKDIVGIRLTPYEFKLFLEKTFNFRLSPPEVCTLFLLSHLSFSRLTPVFPTLRLLPCWIYMALNLPQDLLLRSLLLYIPSQIPNRYGAVLMVDNSSPPSSSLRSRSL